MVAECIPDRIATDPESYGWDVIFRELASRPTGAATVNVIQRVD